MIVIELLRPFLHFAPKPLVYTAPVIWCEPW